MAPSETASRPDPIRVSSKIHVDHPDTAHQKSWLRVEVENTSDVARTVGPVSFEVQTSVSFTLDEKNDVRGIVGSTRIEPHDKKTLDVALRTVLSAAEAALPGAASVRAFVEHEGKQYKEKRVVSLPFEN